MPLLLITRETARLCGVGISILRTQKHTCLLRIFSTCNTISGYTNRCEDKLLSRQKPWYYQLSITALAYACLKRNQLLRFSRY
ncbi:uncharacterized protein EAF01_004474 [Botrytis porri]|uniref:uncharacterized protein n=1 Tax=Botrytis porri TaxID=87229 RepID=UPI0019027D6F|nr:uncharacterized protein EAF01_004474 [Botrytis porri]KAF7908719.1 hypothetical protein EAF01_004474 [Botrytis porri]